MKVTLISPYKMVWSPGVRILSACLKEEGHDVIVIFLPGEFTDKYEESVLNSVVDLSADSGLIGVALMTNFFDKAVQITQKLKKSLNIPIIWGGVHPTIRPEECLDYADIVCRGEGEQSLVELVRRMENGENYYGVTGMWFKANGEIIKNELRSPVKDMDSIPFQDYSYKNHYVLSSGCICKMDEILLKKCLSGSYEIMATRGCPYGCAYCCNSTFNAMHPNETPVRKRSIENIIKELIEVKQNLPFIECIRLDDDNFFAYSMEDLEKFCAEYKKNIGLNMHVTGVHPNIINRERLTLFLDAGLTFVRIGIQTASERTKKLYNRRQTNKQVAKSVKLIHSFRDKIKLPQYDIILDNPWETEDDLIETLMFLAKLPSPYYLELLSLTFYPETLLYKKAKSEGIITDDLKDVYRKPEYHNCKRHYLNELFFLLKDYARRGERILPITMFFLTNYWFRKLKISWFVYKFLNARNQSSKNIQK